MIPSKLLKKASPKASMEKSKMDMTKDSKMIPSAISKLLAIKPKK